MTDALRRYPFQAMGSFCEIQFLDASRINSKKNLRQLLAEVDRLEKKYSRYHPDSFLNQINFLARDRLGIKIDMETRSLFDHALQCYEQSDGLFDITSGVLRKVWDFKSGQVPEQTEIDKLLPNIGFDKLELKKSRLYMPKNMEIDFGGIVKEYAADSVATMARNLGIESGLVNLGGDFAVIGPLPVDHSWPIGILHPVEGELLMAKLKIKHGGLASSGDYERAFVHQGKRYSHILNPKTGWPCDGLRAVSVCADLCTLAGSASTIAMLKPEAEGIEWLRESGVDHIYMTSDETIGGQGIVPADEAEETD